MYRDLAPAQDSEGLAGSGDNDDCEEEVSVHGAGLTV